MGAPVIPDDLQERLRTSGLLEAFIALPVDLQTDFIEFIQSSEDGHHRAGRIEMVANLMRRSLFLLLVFELADHAFVEPVMRIRELLAA